MPKFNVRKSVRILAPIQKVYDCVRDFRQWNHWSPWVIAEPETRLEYSEDGRSYSWEGRIVGAGDNAIIAETAPTSIDYRLVFRKPWKSVAAVRFQFAERGEETEVTWSMESSVPFFLFFMKNMMAAFVEMDYQRGLNMLKDYLETGAVPSKLEFLGRQSFPGFRYVGVQANCSDEDIGETMQATMKRVKALLKEGNIQTSGDAFSVYHKFDPVKKIAIFTAGYPVAAPPARLPDGLIMGEVPPTPVYSIQHTGPYRHLGNVWSAGMMHARAKVFRQNKKIACFETYGNEPDDTPENELVTTVHMPAK